MRQIHHGPWLWKATKPQRRVRPFKQLGLWQLMQLWLPRIHAWKSSSVLKPNLCSWNQIGHSRFGQKSEEALHCFISANHHFSDETATAFMRLGTNLCNAEKRLEKATKRCKACHNLHQVFIFFGTLFLGAMLASRRHARHQEFTHSEKSHSTLVIGSSGHLWSSLVSQR